MSDADPAAAFDALGDETRVAILRALVEHRRDAPTDPALSFSELRRRVGASDSGRFNYHLGKLRGRFVENTDDGYELTFAGERMATAVLSGAVSEDAKLGPRPLDHDCPLCERGVEATYEDGHVHVACTNDHHLFSAPAPPALARERDFETVLSVAVQESIDALSLAKRGVCRACYGEMSAGLEPRDGDEYDWRYVFRATCDRCGEFYGAPVGGALLDHPALVEFFWSHGRDPSDEYPWLYGFLSPDDRSAVVSEDPLRVRVTVELDGDEFAAVVDEDGHVVDADVSA
ncbi:MAG: winged helix-turn-helix domain-containing protein [Halobacterium sp.]